MQVSPFTVAEESLGASSAMHGLGGMERTAAPKGPNMFDSGAASKVRENTQPYNNARMQQQGILQNTTSAAQQAQSDAVQMQRKLQLVEDNAQYKAISQRETTKAAIMDMMNTPATLAMGNMSPPEQAKMRNDVAVGKAQSMGINPALVQNQLSERRYG
jgi:uncharacterized protein YfcZ (UPF0381/DUF406 family)